MEAFKSLKDLYSAVVKEIKAIQEYKNLSIFWTMILKLIGSLVLSV